MDAEPAEPDFGDLLARGWALTWRNGVPLFQTWAALALPALALDLAVSAATGVATRDDLKAAFRAARYDLVFLYLASTLASRWAGAVALAATVVAANETLEGRPCDPSAAWTRFRGLFGAWFWTNLVYGARVLVGYLLLVVPGIVMSIRWTLHSFAVLVEGRSGSDALDRSRQIVVPRLVTVLCAAWGSAAIATAVSYFASTLAVLFTVAVAVVLRFTAGDAADPLGRAAAMLFALPVAVVDAAATAWSLIVVLITFRELAARHPEAPETGYFL